MKGFISVVMSENDAQWLISISSISMLEEYPQFKCRIVLKERIESTGTNFVAVVKQSYREVVNLIDEAQKEQ